MSLACAGTGAHEYQHPGNGHTDLSERDSTCRRCKRKAMSECRIVDGKRLVGELIVAGIMPRSRPNRLTSGLNRDKEAFVIATTTSIR